MINQSTYYELNPFVKDFFNYLKILKKSDNTIESYYYDLREWIKFQFSDLDSKDVTLQQFESLKLQDFYNFLASISYKADTSQLRNLMTIKSFYNYLYENERITINPAKNIKQPKIEEKMPVYLSEKESIKLLESVDEMGGYNKVRNYCIFTLLLNTGLRVSELVNIEIDKINFEEQFLLVKGKGNKQRFVPLNSACMRVIDDYMKDRNHKESNILFINTRGNPLTRHNVLELVKRHGEYIGKPNITPHKLRHTSATTWLTNGADIFNIKEILGHNDLRTTSRYAHATRSSMNNIVNNTSLSSIKR
jgi:integrase/recombinase XerD